MLKEFTKSFYLAAGECNPQAELPIPMLLNRVIEIATLHANSWGVGYATLIKDNQVWVLTRVTVEMESFPRVNEEYSFTTWIEGYNRLFSQRNMEIRNHRGEPVGYVRTIWMVIDFNTRESADISRLSYIRENISEKPCPIAPQGRLRMVTSPTETQDHTFAYCECDFNRHVNTTRYVELFLNSFPLSFHDANMVKRLEIAFTKETRCGEEVTISKQEEAPLDYYFSIDNDGGTHCRAHITFVPRPQ